MDIWMLVGLFLIGYGLGMFTVHIVDKITDRK